MAAAISCMRALPAGSFRIAIIENTPYKTAITPAPISGTGWTLFSTWTVWADPRHEAFVRKSQDGLRVLAEETGGLAVVNMNDFDKALKRIDAETSDYYVLGYYSSNPDPLRRIRKIEVRTTRQNVTIKARETYSLRPNPGK